MEDKPPTLRYAPTAEEAAASLFGEDPLARAVQSHDVEQAWLRNLLPAIGFLPWTSLIAITFGAVGVYALNKWPDQSEQMRTGMIVAAVIGLGLGLLLLLNTTGKRAKTLRAKLSVDLSLVGYGAGPRIRREIDLTEAGLRIATAFGEQLIYYSAIRSVELKGGVLEIRGEQCWIDINERQAGSTRALEQFRDCIAKRIETGTRTQSSVAEFLQHHDAPCIGCGYQLRGSRDNQCPECAREIEEADLPLAIYNSGGVLSGKRRSS